MAFTEVQKVALEKALVSGTTEVSYDGKTVKFRSIAELKEVLATVNAGLSGAPRRRTLRIFTQGDKGL